MVIEIESTVLDEESAVEHGYRKEDLKVVASEFVGRHITREPRSDVMKHVIGTVDDSWYEDSRGVVLRGTIYDEFMEYPFLEGLIDVAPILVTSPGDGSILDVDSVFVTDMPHSVVGETEVVEGQR